MGFDNECILNIQSLAGEYFCPVCRLLVYPHEALQSQCTHLYCKPCLTYVASTTRACPYDGYLVTEADSKPLLESNKVLSDTIGKIAVHCLYYRSGCTWQGTLSDCTSHCLSCAFGNSPVVCNRCGIQIVHRQVQEHAQSCPGVQSQAQQTENIQNAAGTATATSADQSQAHTQNSAVVATSGQQSEQANSITQAQVPPNPVQSSDQWYQQQQQQQYQQYFAQYSGYDAYQQHYLQYYPYQQQAVQQYQQQPVQVHPAPSVLPGQVPPQVCMQPQTQFQQQPQPQIQSQPQMQAQLQQQPQPQAQTLLQSLPTQSVQAPLGTQYQNQSVNPQQQPPPSVQPQPQPPSHGQSISQTQPYHHGHTQPQPNLVQPQMQSHHQTPQYQQPHLMIQQPQTPAGLAQPLPTQSLQQPHTQPRPQSQYQAHLQPHPQPHPPFQHHSLSQGPHAQPSQPSQPYTQHSSVHAVTGHNSYLLPQAQQQMAVPQHPMQVHPQTVPTQTHQPQHAFPVQSQPVQQPGQVHPLNPNAPAQLQPPLLPSPGRVPSLPPPPHLVNPLSQQPNHLVNQRPVMQPNQQPSQLHGQKQVLYAGQSQGSLQNQSHQISPLVPQNFSAQSQLRPQGPLPIPSQSHILQHPHAHPPSQNLPSSQSYVGRPLIPGGSQSQSFLQTPGAHAGTSQARPMPLSVNLESTNQNSRRTTSQVVPPSDYGHMQQSAQWVTGTTSKVTTLEKQDNHFSNKGPVEHIVSSSSHKIENLDNNSVTSSSLGANSVEVGVLKSETDKRMDDEHKPHQDGASDVEILGSSKALCTDSKSQEIEHAEPVIKQKVKEEAAANVLDSVSRLDEHIDEDQKDDNKAGHAENSSVDNKGSQRQAEFNEHRNGKLESDAVDADAVVKIGIDDVDNAGQDFTAAPTSVSNSSAQIVVGQGQLPDREKIKIDRALPHGEAIPQGPAFDEHKSLPALAQVPAQGHVLSSQQRPSAPHGPPLVPRRPSAPLMLPSVPSAAVPHYGRGLGLSPAQLRPQGTGHFSQPGQLENFQRFGGVPGSYGVSFGSGPVSFGPSPRSFESQPSFHGPNNILQDEAFRGMPPAELPPGSFDRLGGMLGGPMLGKGLQYAPEGPMGLQRFNPMDVEPFPNKRHCYTDDRQSDLQKMGPVVGGPFGHLSGHQSKVERLDGTQGLSNKKFSFGEEHLNVEHNQHVIGRGVYADDLKHHSKPPHLDADSVPKFGNQLTFSRASDMGPHSLGFDAIPHSFDKAPYNSRPGLNLDSGSCGVTPGFMPSYQSGFQERRGRLASYEENVNKPDLTHTSAEFLGSGAGYGQRHIDVLNSRNPVGEFHPPGYGSSGPGSQTILDDVDGRESHQFEESSRPYNAPFGSFRESRFPDFSSRFGRSDFDGSANLRAGELISGRDFPSSQFLHNERIGPRELSSHLPQGEPGGFGSYPRGPAHLGELAAPKNFPRHFFAGEPFGTDSKLRPQLGEPGFRSSYSLHGHHNDRGFFLGNMESIDILRKRKPGSMGWCRICEVDSETLEGLDLHSQTREHQKKAMDMVTNIKKKNAKKQKISLGAHSHASVEDTNKSQNVTFDGREN